MGKVKQAYLHPFFDQSKTIQPLQRLKLSKNDIANQEKANDLPHTYWRWT